MTELDFGSGKRFGNEKFEQRIIILEDSSESLLQLTEVNKLLSDGWLVSTIYPIGQNSKNTLLLLVKTANGDIGN